MPRTLLCTFAATVAALALFTGAASASGPAPPGKEIVNVTCEGIGPLTVSVARGEKSHGAGQIVGQKGHGIPVTNTFTLTDITTERVVFTETRLSGGGHGHSNQAATPCSAIAFSGTAEEFFGTEPLPEGVSPTDELEGTILVDVIVKQ